VLCSELLTDPVGGPATEEVAGGDIVEQMLQGVCEACGSSGGTLSTTDPVAARISPMSLDTQARPADIASSSASGSASQREGRQKTSTFARKTAGSL
jgi:hypothetical protein